MSGSGERQVVGDVYGVRGVGDVCQWGASTRVGKASGEWRRRSGVFFSALPWYYDWFGPVMVPVFLLVWFATCAARFSLSLEWFERFFGPVEVCRMERPIRAFCERGSPSLVYYFARFLSQDRFCFFSALSLVAAFVGDVRITARRTKAAAGSACAVAFAAFVLGRVSFLAPVSSVLEVYAATMAVLVAKDMDVAVFAFYLWALVRLTVGVTGLSGPVIVVLAIVFCGTGGGEVSAGLGEVKAEFEVVGEETEVDEGLEFVRRVVSSRVPVGAYAAVQCVDPQEKVEFERISGLALVGDRWLKLMLAKHAVKHGYSRAQSATLESALQSDRALIAHRACVDRGILEKPERFRGSASATAVEAACGLVSERVGLESALAASIFWDFSVAVALSNGFVIRDGNLEPH